jgi:serine protease AprX
MTEGLGVVCALCRGATTRKLLAEAAWQKEEILARIGKDHPDWRRADGACPACVQQALLTVLLERDDAALHDGVQNTWPLQVDVLLGALPTPLRMHADPRCTGRGVTIAFVDAGFYPHPDLIKPQNRIRAWADAGNSRLRSRFFKSDEQPEWPGWDLRRPSQWHGMMTSSSACGNGFLSRGLYRGMGSDADVVLVQTRDARGHITCASITRALRWLRRHAKQLNLRIVSCSVSAEPEDARPGNAVDEEVRHLVEEGIVVIAAAGNDGVRRLIPPATAPAGLTIGGLDDKNVFNHHSREVWHSNYGEATNGISKPELVAPSIWIAAPVMPGSDVAREAEKLFARRAAGDKSAEERIAQQKLISPHYQHVEGTSFAAPLVASAAACLLEANPQLTPQALREILIAAARPVAGAPVERQGAGALDAGLAVAMALEARDGSLRRHADTPEIQNGSVVFHLHERESRAVQVVGSWNGWRAPGLIAEQLKPGFWRAELPLPAPGRYAYKFILDGTRWLGDPANPRREHDGHGNLNSVFEIDRNDSGFRS